MVRSAGYSSPQVSAKTSATLVRCQIGQRIFVGIHHVTLTSSVVPRLTIECAWTREEWPVE